jgi:hypothetical protein
MPFKKTEKPATEARYEIRLRHPPTFVSVSDGVAASESYRTIKEAAQHLAKEQLGSRIDVYDLVVDAAVAGYDERGEWWETDEL